MPNSEYDRVVSRALETQAAKLGSEYVMLQVGDYKYTFKNDEDYDIRIIRKRKA